MKLLSGQLSAPMPARHRCGAEESGPQYAGKGPSTADGAIKHAVLSDSSSRLS